MIDVKGYAARTAKSRLAPFTFSRRNVGRQDVLIGIRYCGICHSDVHQARDEWGGSIFPWYLDMKSWALSNRSAPP